MSRRLLVPLGAAVTGLLVLAAVASRGRPLGGGGAGEGPTAGFFDYVFTTIVIVAVTIGIVALVAALTVRPVRRRASSSGRRYLLSMLAFVSAVAVAWALAHSGFEKRLQRLHDQAGTQTGQTPAGTVPAAPPGTRGARLRWDEVAFVLALLAGVGALVLAGRPRRRPASARRRASQEMISQALDQSLDDLRAEPDLRKAIIAAYARMERALAVAGLPRRPSEAPVEYVERALVELEASAPAASRLTDLFEWAKFSQHDPDAWMRDEAIDALVAVRDELRAPPEEVAV
jgi:hypothetical protein